MLNTSQCCTALALTNPPWLASCNSPALPFGIDLNRVRFLPPSEHSDELFYAEATRQVKKDNTFSFNGRRYETPVDLRNKEVQFLEGQIAELRSVLGDVNENDAMKLHSPYTWTLQQVIGHLIDGERIFADRLHRFASGDYQQLPGMDQDPYVANHDYVNPTLTALLEELIHLRQANILLLRRVKPEAWDHRGVASNHPVTVRALAYILVGHINHHLKIVRKRLGH